MGTLGAEVSENQKKGEDSIKLACNFCGADGDIMEGMFCCPERYVVEQL